MLGLLGCRVLLPWRSARRNDLAGWSAIAPRPTALPGISWTGPAIRCLLAGMHTSPIPTGIVRALVAALCLALLPSVSSAAPVVRHSPRPAEDPAAALIGRLELGGSLGLAIPFESGIDTGFKLNGAAFYGVMPLAPRVILQLGGNLAWTYHSASSPVDGSFTFWDILPTARARMSLDQRLFAYGDLGLGIGLARASINVPGFGTQTASDTAFLLKLGGGVGWDLNPQLSLVGEPALCIYMKDGSTTELTLMFGVLYRP
jgi:opacity protein-like surface antigen